MGARKPPPPRPGSDNDLPANLRTDGLVVEDWVDDDEPPPAYMADSWDLYGPHWRLLVAGQRQREAMIAWCEERGRDWRAELRRLRRET